MRRLKKEIWPVKIKINSDNLSDITPIEIWLGETLGAFKDRWNVVYNLRYTDFYFRSDKDATMFSLRWS